MSNNKLTSELYATCLTLGTTAGVAVRDGDTPNLARMRAALHRRLAAIEDQRANELAWLLKQLNGDTEQ